MTSLPGSGENRLISTLCHVNVLAVDELPDMAYELEQLGAIFQWVIGETVPPCG
jgi:hypothetical protein